MASGALRIGHHVQLAGEAAINGDQSWAQVWPACKSLYLRRFRRFSSTRSPISQLRTRTADTFVALRPIGAARSRSIW